MLSKTWLSALALTTGLILGASTTGLTQTAPSVPPPTQRPATGRHLHIMAAERALRHAERQLEEAAHHFGGHRVKALELVKQAEVELREALAYANAHPEEFTAK
jgi:hypothetical protein